jgi:hypothetical protein
MAHETESLQGFIEHRSTDRSGGFLGNWKSRAGSKVNVFLHTKILPISLWRHGLPKFFVKEDDDGEALVRVFSDNLNCWEEERVLKRQYKYDNGKREIPPVACPLCLLIEAVKKLIDDEKIGWTAPLFRFIGDDPKESVVIHAGGFIGEYNDDCDEKEKTVLKKAGISLSTAWKENCRAKMSYVFYVVDADHVDKGVQVAIETGLLGDKVKDVISDAVESLGEDKGDFRKHPYAIQWKHLPDETLPNKKYKATRLERVLLTPEIEKLIRGDKPDYKNVVKPFSRSEIRARLEKACDKAVREIIPWDDVFERVRPNDGDGDDVAKDAGETRVSPDRQRAPEVGQVAATEDDEVVACDDGAGGGCGKAMSLSDPKCPHCGLVYEVEAKEPEPPPPPKPVIRSRSEAKAQASKPTKPTKYEKQGNEDDIPF